MSIQKERLLSLIEFAQQAARMNSKAADESPRIEARRSREIGKSIIETNPCQPWLLSNERRPT
jgi:hypothetical protein